ncbi:GNAT family N-acetyltransferase [Marinomonas posidonica]|uniref:GCN5-related N-acetyltransferase n=1 Tax=Marinomonas posidonica (strain CECT 7376 / NCIMB 14433 / IVIA-Po-181) TaxID=491952 RepID=F6CWN7_MARPP|nr:GNAT family N-acetyltransferase [Marinomonas posidonica]AEF54387.1 GCN5-related N-acetyltransferase [Marinomonas posidonica IVIA-Po-181]
MDEYIELDLLTLSKLSEEAGMPIDVNKYQASLASAKEAGLLFECRKNGDLLGYFILRELAKDVWFVPMFVVHPNHRNKVVFWSLFSQLKKFITKHHVVTLISNVYRNNELSNNFHKRLGFFVTRENEHGFEYTLEINDKLRKKWQEI